MPTLKRVPYDKELEQLRKTFLKAETDIINEIGRLRSMGLVDYHAVAALERVQNILRSLTDECWRYVPVMIEKQFYVRSPEVRKIVEPVSKHIKGYINAEALTTTQHSIIDKLTMNLMGEITEASTVVLSTLQNALIGRTENDVYRRAGLELVSNMQATGRGVAKTVPQFVQTLLQEGVTAFVDKAGRNWSLHTYGSMVCRTTSRQAEVLAVLTADPEHDLYKISSHGTTCKICAPLEGRVYSKSGKDPDFPPLASAFGKIDPNGPDDLINSYLNIHPNCLHILTAWTPAGRTEKEIEEIKKKSSFKTNPPNIDPRTQKQIEAYRKKEQARAKWLRDYRQWEKYRTALGDVVPKTFQTFQKHKLAEDEIYKDWLHEYRFIREQERFSSLVGVSTVNGIRVTGISQHVIERAVSRQFSAKSALDALQNPKKIGNIKIDEKGASRRFTGEKAAVVINPDTGMVITGWRK
ncbi:MAG: phage minor capsid protein [Candidatus Metalachnospira sp.]|nr:phage minor capsid protein [Candidatus Metalachnospira sp.]